MYASSSDTFYKYYAQGQRGGALGSVDGIPVFRASRRHVQGGAGLGDMLRNAFRWFLPVAMRGASTFANQFLKSHEQGATFRDAAKAAIGPTLGVAGEAIKSRIEARAKQQEAEKAAAAAGTAPANGTKSSWFGLRKQSGTGRKRKRVYKGGSKAKKRKTSKRKQLGLGRRRKAKKQLGGKKRKQRGGKKRKTKKRKTTKRRAPAIASYNF